MTSHFAQRGFGAAHTRLMRLFTRQRQMVRRKFRTIPELPNASCVNNSSKLAIRGSGDDRAGRYPLPLAGATDIFHVSMMSNL
jgi:hypothetical protein